ncbi:MAG TPA: methyl-accepting chemotaxis protein, partial [Rudaea sp.]
RLTLEDKNGMLRSLAEGINALVGSVEKSLGEIGRVLGALAAGDLRQTVDGDFQGMLGKLRDDTNLTVRQLSSMVAQIKSSAENIALATGNIASDTNDVATQTEQQAASLEETASSMQELTSTVKQNADNAREATRLAAGATDVALKGGKVVSDVVATMQAISESSRKISDIIGVIDGIAFQTNILALNAAVEAARAGEQGRGFAVVASEVRHLAQRSANAAKEIKTLIGNSTEKVDAGARLVHQAGATMQEIVASIRHVNDIMGEISLASQEQSSGIEQVNATIVRMDESTQQNAALVEGASTAAQDLQTQAQTLSDAVARFRLVDSGSAAARIRKTDRLTTAAA